ncbi:pilus assembly protein PilM [Geomonas sp. RF6]|uniref:type IV pilus biogenesis protein PilM n=1 Tax=Geomonas sp. RF6 TaxID=2897342 RepID=UPI001E63DF5A|nr:pilus assembly protein PilM [Geomonas sp. RF6]UFS70873.1 pilus assembly protein PilM [Geomonas sp. RF6]
MLFAKRGVGLELAPDGLKLALAGGSARALKVEGYQTAPFPEGTLRLSRREPNVLNPQAFVSAVREGYLKLLARGKSVSVSLPDAVGRVLLLDLEARFKSREEGLDIIRWKLKKNFPMEISSMHLDYQTLHQTESGAVSLLVSLISRDIITQYEELLLLAGVEPRFIDFTSFNLYRLFAHRLEMAENLAFVTFYGGSLSMLIFYAGELCFYRNKELASDAASLYREVNSSFLVYKDKFPGRPVNDVFCMAGPAEAEAFRVLVSEASGIEPVLLDVERLTSSGSGFSAERATLHTLCGALGAAARSLS